MKTTSIRTDDVLTTRRAAVLTALALTALALAGCGEETYYDDLLNDLVPNIAITRPTAEPTHETPYPEIIVGGPVEHVRHIDVLNAATGKEVRAAISRSGDGLVWAVLMDDLAVGDNFIMATAQGYNGQEVQAQIIIRRLNQPAGMMK